MARVQLCAIGSRDPVSQAITTTKSTTPLLVDLDSNASLWYALRDFLSLTIRRIVTLTSLNMKGNVNEDMTARRKTYADFLLFLGEVHE